MHISLYICIYIHIHTYIYSTLRTHGARQKDLRLREAMQLFVESSRSVVDNGKHIPRRVCRHFVKPCLKKKRRVFRLFVTHYKSYNIDTHN